jgi:hypothetical protein
MKFIKRPLPQSAGEVQEALVRDGPVVRRFPALLEFLTATSWAPGEPRRPGTLTLFTDDGQWKASLNDKDGDRTAFVTGDSPEGVLVALEKGLQEDSLSWRSWGNTKGKKR